MRNLELCIALIAGLLSVVAPAAAGPGHEHGSKVSAEDEHDDHADGDDHDDHAEGDDHDHGDHDDHGEHGDEVKLSPAAAERAGIRIGKAEMRALSASIVAPGRLAFDGDSMAHVGSVVEGRIVELKIRVGDAVKKGDVLVVVESPELGRSQSEFLQRRTEADVAAAAVAPSKDAYDRAQQLFDQTQGIAFTEVQKRQVEYQAAVGNAATSKAAMQAAENELHLLGVTQEEMEKLIKTGEINPRYEIRAPINGKVIEREVTLGELVSPDKERLIVLADTSSYWVWADVPEARLGEIGVGSSADVLVAALGDQRIAGEVSLLSAEVDPNTRSARVRVVVKNGNNTLRPGMFARVTVFAEEGERILSVPEEAVQTVEGEPSVFVPVDGEPNTFAKRPIKHGKSISGYVPVLSGLEEGEPLAVAGSFILKAQLGKSEASHEH